MADEIKDTGSPEVIEVQTPQAQESAQVEYSEQEQLAMEQGWVPEDQWSGKGKWRSAEDFLERGEIFAKIDSHKRRADRIEQTLEDLKKHHSKVREVEFNRAIQVLKAEKKDALDNGDSARVVEIDEELAEAKAEKAKAAFEQVQPQHGNQQTQAALDQFLARNKWYETDVMMKAAAEAVVQELVFSGEKDPYKVLAEAERRVKKEFAHKFTNPNRDKVGAVEGGGKPVNSGRKDSIQLTSEETQVMNRFVRAGVMTKEEYIAEIKASRGN